MRGLSIVARWTSSDRLRLSCGMARAGALWLARHAPRCMHAGAPTGLGPGGPPGSPALAGGLMQLSTCKRHWQGALQLSTVEHS